MNAPVLLFLAIGLSIIMHAECGFLSIVKKGIKYGGKVLNMLLKRGAKLVLSSIKKGGNLLKNLSAKGKSLLKKVVRKTKSVTKKLKEATDKILETVKGGGSEAAPETTGGKARIGLTAGAGALAGGAALLAGSLTKTGDPAEQESSAEGVTMAVQILKECINIATDIDDVVRDNTVKFAEVKADIDGLFLDYGDEFLNFGTEKLCSLLIEIRDNLLYTIQEVLEMCTFNVEQQAFYREFENDPQADGTIENAIQWRLKYLMAMLVRSVNVTDVAVNHIRELQASLNETASDLETISELFDTVCNETMEEIQQQIDSDGYEEGVSIKLLGVVQEKNLDAMARARYIETEFKAQHATITGYFARTKDYVEWLREKANYLSDRVFPRDENVMRIIYAIEDESISVQDSLSQLLSNLPEEEQTINSLDDAVDEISRESNEFQQSSKVKLEDML